MFVVFVVLSLVVYFLPRKMATSDYDFLAGAVQNQEYKKSSWYQDQRAFARTERRCIKVYQRTNDMSHQDTLHALENVISLIVFSVMRYSWSQRLKNNKIIILSFTLSNLLSFFVNILVILSSTVIMSVIILVIISSIFIIFVFILVMILVILSSTRIIFVIILVILSSFFHFCFHFGHPFLNNYHFVIILTIVSSKLIIFVIILVNILVIFLNNYHVCYHFGYRFRKSHHFC